MTFGKSMKNETDVRDASLAAGEEKKRRRQIFSLTLVCCGVVLWVISLLIERSSDAARILRVFGSGLISVGFVHVLSKPRSIPEENK